jgi:hypothetical protein
MPKAIGELTGQQRAWALHSEGLWRRAHEIVRANPSIDPGDVYRLSSG